MSTRARRTSSRAPPHTLSLCCLGGGTGASPPRSAQSAGARAGACAPKHTQRPPVIYKLCDMPRMGFKPQRELRGPRWEPEGLAAGRWAVGASPRVPCTQTAVCSTGSRSPPSPLSARRGSLSGSPARRGRHRAPTHAEPRATTTPRGGKAGGEKRRLAGRTHPRPVVPTVVTSDSHETRNNVLASASEGTAAQRVVKRVRADSVLHGVLALRAGRAG